LPELGVNFINILCAALTHPDPKSAKRHWQLDWIFTLLGFASVKGHILIILVKRSTSAFPRRQMWNSKCLNLRFLLYSFSFAGPIAIQTSRIRWTTSPTGSSSLRTCARPSRGRASSTWRWVLEFTVILQVRTRSRANAGSVRKPQVQGNPFCGS